MQADNRIFDDFVKFVNGAAGTFAGMGREAEAGARARFKEWIGGQDFVSREEFDAVKAMAAAARDEVDALRARLDALEGAGPPVVVKPARKAAAKKAAPKA
ncbi:MAG TPA: accessory factor UbiK family protein [Sphingomonas sp.]|nr:accessory factor UbiK family protein [Sphingomonas sp.]